MDLALPQHIQGFADANGFVPESVVETGYCSMVYLSADRALKCPFQGEEQTSGLRAAIAYGEHGIGPRIYDYQEQPAALLMERIVPGENILNLPETEARRVATALMTQTGKIAFSGPLPLKDFVCNSEIAHRLRSEPSVDPVYLHGDLHHENILTSGKQYRLIDPKGLLGDPAFEPSAFMRNAVSEHLSAEEVDTLLVERAMYFGDALNLCPARIAGWALVAIEDEIDGRWRRIVDSLRRILPQIPARA